MYEPQKKRSWLARISPRNRTILGVVIIAVIVVLALKYAPPEGESNNVTGDPASTPTVTINNLVDTLVTNQQVDYKGVRIKVTQALEAQTFSNDRKRLGSYTARIVLEAQLIGKDPIGIDYASVVKLVLPNGEEVEPKYASVAPVVLPNQPQTGFIDFPLSEQVSLSSLSLRFGEQTTIALSGS